MDLSKKYLKVCKIDDANFGKFVVSSRVVKSIKKMALSRFIED